MTKAMSLLFKESDPHVPIALLSIISTAGCSPKTG